MSIPRLLGVCCASFGLLFSSLSYATAVSGQGSWETTLQPRDLDGNPATIEAYYDTVLNITWLADANAAVGSSYDTFSPGSGLMVWGVANNWAASLNFNGITGWQLPDTNPVNGTAYNYNFTYDGSTDVGVNISASGTTYAGSTGSEMSHLFYNTLGNTAFYDTVGNATGCIAPNYCLTNTGPFSNLQPAGYWSATSYMSPTATPAWRLDFNTGIQQGGDKIDHYYALAVHSGDVGAAVVPVPATVWLFGSGMLGLIGVSRRREKA